MSSGHFRQLVAFAPSQRDHVPALRIAGTVAVPLLILLALGRMDLGIYASFGAFTSLYARQEPLVQRFRHQCLAAAMLSACIVLGVAMSAVAVNTWVLILVCAVVGGLGASASAFFNLRPPGAVFFIFATGAIGSIAHPAPVLLALGVGIGAALWSVLAGLLGVLLGEGQRGPVAAMPPAHSGMDVPALARYGLSFVVATLIAGLIGNAFGISRPYWAMVAAAAAIAAPNVLARLYRSVHRITGTFGGLLVTAFVLTQNPDPWHLVVYVVLFQFLAETYVGRNYAFAQLFITPLALLMMQLSHPVPAGEILTARLLETAIGSAVAFLMVLLTRTRTEKAADTQAIPVLRARHHHGRPGDAGPEDRDENVPGQRSVPRVSEDSDTVENNVEEQYRS